MPLESISSNHLVAAPDVPWSGQHSGPAGSTKAEDIVPAASSSSASQPASPVPLRGESAPISPTVIVPNSSGAVGEAEGVDMQPTANFIVPSHEQYQPVLGNAVQWRGPIAPDQPDGQASSDSTQSKARAKGKRPQTESIIDQSKRPRINVEGARVVTDERRTVAATNIQRIYRGYIVRREQLRAANNQTSHSPFFTSQASTLTRTYYHQSDRANPSRPDLPPVLATFAGRKKGQLVGEGSFNKAWTAPWGDFVVLHSKGAQSAQPPQAWRAEHKSINDLPSFVLAADVAPGISIARNAGVALNKLEEANKTLPLQAFESVSADLRTAHSRGIFLRDIKPDNITYQEKKEERT